jgi:hypothetical protein
MCAVPPKWRVMLPTSQRHLSIGNTVTSCLLGAIDSKHPVGLHRIFDRDVDHFFAVTCHAIHTMDASSLYYIRILARICCLERKEVEEIGHFHNRTHLILQRGFGVTWWQRHLSQYFETALPVALISSPVADYAVFQDSNNHMEINPWSWKDGRQQQRHLG